MRAIIIVCSIGVAACDARSQRNDALDPEPQAQVVLVVHWTADGGDYSRDYPTMSRCQAARQVILEDTARRTRISADVAKEEGVAPSPDAIPVPICIPT